VWLHCTPAAGARLFEAAALAEELLYLRARALPQDVQVLLHLALASQAERLTQASRPRPGFGLHRGVVEHRMWHLQAQPCSDTCGVFLQNKKLPGALLERAG